MRWIRAHTIRRIADETSPTTLSAFNESDFDFYFTDSEIGGVCVDLSLEWFYDQRFVSVFIR
jgi:hypothetical protein